MGSGASQAPPSLHVVNRDARPDPALRLRRFREQHPDIKIDWRNPWEAEIPNRMTVMGAWSPTSCTTCWTRSNAGLPGKPRLVSNGRGDASVPDWTPEQLTDGELISRKAELEGKLKVFTPDSPRAALLRADLAAVIAEQEDRKRTRSSRQTRLAGA